MISTNESVNQLHSSDCNSLTARSAGSCFSIDLSKLNWPVMSQKNCTKGLETNNELFRNFFTSFRHISDQIFSAKGIILVISCILEFWKGLAGKKRNGSVVSSLWRSDSKQSGHRHYLCHQYGFQGYLFGVKFCLKVHTIKIIPPQSFCYEH